MNLIMSSRYTDCICRLIQHPTERRIVRASFSDSPAPHCEALAPTTWVHPSPLKLRRYPSFPACSSSGTPFFWFFSFLFFSCVQEFYYCKMAVVEILLLCVVGFAVLVFVVVDGLNLMGESRKKHEWLLEEGEKKTPNCEHPNLGLGEEELDDWEGIERSELERVFGEAVVFMSHRSNADKIDGDVKLQLYGLQKVALQGPCHGSQPLAFKPSTRAKWTAWQKVGKMSPEMAMEKYVNILTETTPGFKNRVGRN